MAPFDWNGVAVFVAAITSAVGTFVTLWRVGKVNAPKAEELGRLKEVERVGLSVSK